MSVAALLGPGVEMHLQTKRNVYSLLKVTTKPSKNFCVLQKDGQRACACRAYVCVMICLCSIVEKVQWTNQTLQRPDSAKEGGPASPV